LLTPPDFLPCVEEGGKGGKGWNTCQWYSGAFIGALIIRFLLKLTARSLSFHSKIVVSCLFGSNSGTLRTGTSSCARAARYHTNAIAVSDFTVATRKWANLYKHRVRRSVTRSEKCFTFTLQKGSLVRPVRALPLEVSQRESPANRFKLLPISRGCTGSFHVRDNHMHLVRSHVLAT